MTFIYIFDSNPGHFVIDEGSAEIPESGLLICDKNYICNIQFPIGSSSVITSHAKAKENLELMSIRLSVRVI
jgi:hypothetical protein